MADAANEDERNHPMTGPMRTADDDEAKQRPEVLRYTVIKRPDMVTLLRADVAGVPVMVRGHDACEHLVNVNRALAIMRLALHKIMMSRSDSAVDAWRALEDVKGVV